MNAKRSLSTAFVGIVAISLLALPAFAADSSAHTLTVTTNAQAYSCSNPIVISGTATGKNPLRMKVKITVTADDNGGVTVASARAKVSGSAYSATVEFTNPSMQEGYFSVTATWEGQTAVDSSAFYWTC